MAQTYNNAIELQQGFKFTEPIVSDDRQYVATLNDVLTIEGLIPNLPIHIADIDVWVEWNGQDKADINNFVERLKSLKDSISNNTTAIAALTSGTQYAIPQTGNTPTNEPSPTVNGIYRVKTINATYVNFGNIVVPNNEGFIYDIQVSGIGTTPVYTLLETNVNLSFDATPTESSTNAPTSGGVFDAIKVVQDDIDLLDPAKSVKFLTNENYVFAVVDLENRFLFGVKTDGTFEIAKSDYSTEIYVNSEIANSISGDIINGETNAVNGGKIYTELLEYAEAKNLKLLENETYIFAIVDSVNRFLVGIRRDGSFEVAKQFPETKIINCVGDSLTAVYKG